MVMRHAESGTHLFPVIYSRDVKVRDVIRMIEADGWQLAVTEGSHRQFKHPTKSGRVTVSGHPGDDMPKGTLGQYCDKLDSKE